MRAFLIHVRVWLHDERCANNSMQEEISLDNCLDKIKFSESGKVNSTCNSNKHSNNSGHSPHIKQLFGLKKPDCINMVAMQCQKGTEDCGLFSIATMTSLVFGEDPGSVNYDQTWLYDFACKLISFLYN